MTIPAGGGEGISCCSYYCINRSLNKAENARTDYFCSWDSLHSHNTIASWRSLMSGRAQGKFAVTVFRLFQPLKWHLWDSKKRAMPSTKGEQLEVSVFYDWIRGVVHLWHKSSSFAINWASMQSYNFSLPWFLTTIYISPCPKILFNCNYTFISAKYFWADVDL